MILMFYTTLGKGERLQWMEWGYRGSERQTEREMRLFMCVYNQFGQSKLRVFLFFPSWTPTINQSKLDSPGSSHSAEETSLLLCLSSCSPSKSPLVSSTLANETVTDWQGKKAIDQRWYSRHGLIDGLHSVSHGELIHYLLGHVVKVDLPGLLAFHLGDLHHAAVPHLGQAVEQVLQVVAEIRGTR